jgi:uncharacterized membrane protein
MARTEKPKSIRFYLYERDDTVRIEWRNWFNFLFVVIVCIIINVAFATNLSMEKQIPAWFLTYSMGASVVLVILFWLLTRHKLTLTPKQLNYQGGLWNMFGATIDHGAINNVHLKFATDYSDGGSDADEYFLYASYSSNRSLRIGGRMDKEDALFLKSEIEKFNKGKVVDRAQPSLQPAQFILNNPFPFYMLAANAMVALFWSVKMGESETIMPTSFRMVLGWAAYVLLVWLFMGWNKKGENSSSTSVVVVSTFLSVIVAIAVFYWIFFV